MIILIILKIIAFLILGILSLVVIATFLPVSINISYIDGKKYYKIKYAFISVISSEKNFLKSKPKLKSKIKFNPSPKNSDKNSEKKSEIRTAEKKTVSDSQPISSRKIKYNPSFNPEKFKKSEKSEKIKKPEKTRLEKISQLWDTITEIWEIASPRVRRICKGIHFDKIYISFVISDSDAYDCALKYGKTCMLLYNTLGVFDKMFSLTKKSIDVKCVFNKEKSIYDISFVLKIYPVVMIFSGISFLWTYYFKIYKIKNKSGGKNKNGKQRTQKRNKKGEAPQ